MPLGAVVKMLPPDDAPLMQGGGAPMGAAEDKLGAKFRFSTAGGIQGTFSRISGLTEETEVVDLRDINDPFQAVKLPGTHGGGKVTFERALVQNYSAMIDWFQQARNQQEGFRRAVTVSTFTVSGDKLWAWKLVNAWPSVLEVAELDAMSSDVAKMTITVVFERLDVSAA